MDMRSYVAGIFPGIMMSIFLYALYFFRNDVFPEPWLAARFAGAPVSIMQIIGMRFRGNPGRLLIDAYIVLIQAGEKTTITEVESVYTANRNRPMDIDTLVRLVREHERKKEYNWPQRHGEI